MPSSPAVILADALKTNQLAEPLGEAVLVDLDAAYSVQSGMIDALGEPMSGWKIGATNAKSQQLMGLGGPFYGPMPQRFCHPADASLPFVPGLIGAEIEIAFKLSKALPKRDASYGLDDILPAIEGVYPAIEVIGLRQRWQGVPEGKHAIADLGANCIFVHAQAAVPELKAKLSKDPSQVTARCLVDGEQTGQGDASLVLGNPFSALLWLANEGPGLAAGDWISTGTLTGLAPLTKACSVVGDFGAFGQVRLSLTT